jgi:DNA polymerase III delta subunit
MQNVAVLLPAVTHENIFKLLDFIGARDTTQALAQLDAILLSGDKPDAIAARTYVMLQRHIRALLLGKYVVSTRNISSKANKVEVNMTSELSSMLNGSPYRLQNAVKQSSNFTVDQLSKASLRILASDMTMKGMDIPECFGVNSHVMSDQPIDNLKMLVVDLCSTL